MNTYLEILQMSGLVTVGAAGLQELELSADQMCHKVTPVHMQSEHQSHTFNDINFKGITLNGEGTI